MNALRIVLAVALALATAAKATTVLSPDAVELSGPQAHVFSAALAVDTPPRLFVLDGNVLSVFGSPDLSSPLRVQLPDGASAVDLFDLNGDGTNELVTVAGTHVLHRTVLASKEAAWQTLIDQPSLYTDLVAAPFPQVLGVLHDGQPVIALPQVTGFELWSTSGELLNTVSYTLPTQLSALPAPPFIVEPLPNAAGGTAVEMVHHILSRQEPPAGTIIALPPEATTRAAVRATDVADLPSDQWPAKLVSADQPELQVLYAPAPPSFDDTFIRLSGAGSSVGAARRYPGRILDTGPFLPDFNGDGFGDLLLWKTASAGASLSTLVSTLRETTWPVRVSIHLYDPTTRLYTAESGGSIRFRIPFSWYEAADTTVPIRNLVLDDLDADGLLDIGFSTRRREYSIWSYQDGFDEPTIVVRTPTPLGYLMRGVQLGPNDQETLLFRAPSSLYVVRIPPR